MLSLPKAKQPDGPLVTLARVRPPSLWQTQSNFLASSTPLMASHVRNGEDANQKFDPLHVEKQKNRAGRGNLYPFDTFLDGDKHASKQTTRTAAMRPQVGWIQTQVCQANNDGKITRDSIRPGNFDRSRRNLARPRTAPAARDDAPRPISSWSAGNEDLTWNLNLSDKKLKTLPEWIWNRTNIRCLKLCRNEIQDIPCISVFQNLTVLKVSMNKLASIPPSIKDLSCLQVLDMSDNWIQHLDDFVLPGSLREARFATNRLRKIPGSLFHKNVFLRIFDCSNNFMQFILLHGCDFDSDLPNLTCLECRGNAILLVPPFEVAEAGSGEVVKHLRRVRQWKQQMDPVVTPLNMQHSLENDASLHEDTNGLRYESPEQEFGKSQQDDGQQNQPCPRTEARTHQLEQNEELLLVVTGTCHTTSNSFITFISDKVAASKTSKRENRQSSEQTNEGCCEEVGGSTKTNMIDGNGTLEPGANFTPVAFRVNYVSKNALLGETGSTRQNGMGEGSEFVMRRAIYVVTWRVHCGREFSGFMEQELKATSETVQYLMNNVPYAHIILVACPHLDQDAKSRPGSALLSGDTEIRRFNEAMRARLEMDSNPELREQMCSDLFQNGCSLNNFGDVHAANIVIRALCNVAQKHPFYHELIPTNVINLREILLSLRESGSLYVSRDEYFYAAETCHVEEAEIPLVTSFLQDMGIVRFWGRQWGGTTNLRRQNVSVEDNIPLFDGTPKFAGDSSSTTAREILADTVYLDFSWVMDLRRRLTTDFDGARLFKFLADNDTGSAFLATKLILDGLLHSKLIPFVWPMLDLHETWPGVEPRSVAAYWQHNFEASEFQNADPRNSKTTISRDQTHRKRIVWSRADLERAFAACVAMKVVIMPVDSTGDWGEHGSLHISLVPILKGGAGKWNKIECGDCLHQMVLRQALQSPSGLAIYEEVKVCFDGVRLHSEQSSTLDLMETHEKLHGKTSFRKSSADAEPSTYERAKESFRRKSESLFQSVPLMRASSNDPGILRHKIGGTMIDVRFSGALQISLKRQKRPHLHTDLGFSSLLSVRTSNQRISHEMSCLPPKLFMLGSVEAIQTIVIYYVSTCEASTTFPSSLLLLNDTVAVNQLKILAEGGDPKIFLDEWSNNISKRQHTTGLIDLNDAILQLKDLLLMLDLSMNPSLRKLPTSKICSMPNLQVLNCCGCLQVIGLPPAVASQGGKATMKYLRTLESSHTINREMQIIVLGNGEAGKSSLISAIMAETNKAGKIGVDERTVGIDIKEWNPTRFFANGSEIVPLGLRCKFLDLGGQDVYSSSHQFFLVPRALYIVAWRIQSGAQDGTELELMVNSWLDALAVRVPGASFLLVATHIDLASDDVVTVQCSWMQAIVQKRLTRLLKVSQAAGVDMITVQLNGMSVRISSLQGVGIPELRAHIIQILHALPWWEEVVPESYQRFRNMLNNKLKTGVSFLQWDEYQHLAKQAHLDEVHLPIATSVLFSVFGHLASNTVTSLLLFVESIGLYDL